MTAPALEHRTVLLGESVDSLAIRPDGVYVDGTFGRGGHSAAILARLGSGGRLIAIDRDPQAVAAGRRWQAGLGDSRVEIEQARFSQLESVLDARGVPAADGVLLDLGVSSPQLDDPSRGFSFREDGPLDMRMDPASGMSASEWLNQAPEEQIAKVLRDYGEERLAVPIAKAIAARCRESGGTALQTTGELSRLVAGIVRRRQKGPSLGKDPSTRTFQALRIHVNGELEELEGVLEAIVRRLKPHGRLAVISFHSLEDRMVKQFIRRESDQGAPRDPVRGGVLPGARVRLRSVARILPSEAEVEANPRSRSAVLRVAERTEDLREAA